MKTSKRAENKVSMGIYIDREVRDEAMSILKEKGVTLTEFIYAQILKLLQRKEDELLQKIKENDGRTRVAKNKKTKR